MTRIHNVIIGVKNLIRWAPIIWRDRHWDYAFLLYMLSKKLWLMEDAIRNGCHMKREEDADKIKVCALLLDRVANEDDYMDRSRPYGVRIDDDKVPGLWLKHGSHWVKRAGKARTEDLEYAFRLMGKYLLGWWD